MRAAGRRDPDERTQEFRVACDQRGRQAAIAAQQRRPVGVGQHGFEQFGALDQSGFQLPPLARLDDQRYVTERPRPLDSGRILVDAIKNSGAAQITVGGGETAIDLLGAERRQHAEKGPPVRAHAAVAVHHLVENAGQPAVVCDELFETGGLVFDDRVEIGCHVGCFKSRTADPTSLDIPA